VTRSAGHLSLYSADGNDFKRDQEQRELANEGMEFWSCPIPLRKRAVATNDADQRPLMQRTLCGLHCDWYIWALIGYVPQVLKATNTPM
jgi:hypothetical protein